MKNIIYLIILNSIIISSVSAQENVDLKDLKTPNSPGFQILDIAPSTIERPTNPKEFAVTLMSLTNNGTIIPKNFAMEFSPFWFLKSDNTSIYKYLNIKSKESSNIYSGILRKTSVSLVSTYSDSTAGSLLKNTNYLAFGIRTNLITIRSKTQSEEIIKALDDYSKRVKELNPYKNELDKLHLDELNSLVLLEQLNDKINNLEEKLKSDLEEAKKNKKKESEIKKIENDALKNKKELLDELNFIEAQKNYINSKIDEYIKKSPNEIEQNIDNDKEIQECYKKMEEFPIFQLDGAFAYSDALPNNQSNNRRFNRSGFWLNAAINLSGLDEPNLNDKLTLMVSTRFISDNILEPASINTFKRENAFDFGYKLEYSLKQLSISIEHLNRTYSSNSSYNTERTVAVLQYKINDDLYFTGTYGKNFGEVNNQFTLFGLNYGFGKSSLKLE